MPEVLTKFLALTVVDLMGPQSRVPRAVGSRLWRVLEKEGEQMIGRLPQDNLFLLSGWHKCDYTFDSGRLEVNAG